MELAILRWKMGQRVVLSEKETHILSDALLEGISIEIDSLDSLIFRKRCYELTQPIRVDFIER